MIPYDPKIWHGSFARPGRLLQLNNLVFLHELHSVVLPVLRLLEGSCPSSHGHTPLISRLLVIVSSLKTILDAGFSGFEEIYTITTGISGIYVIFKKIYQHMSFLVCMS